MNNWEEFAKTWGPAVPMFGVICFFLHRLVFRAIPRGFRLLRVSIRETSEQAKANHQEAMAALCRLEELIRLRNARQQRPKTKPRKA